MPFSLRTLLAVAVLLLAGSALSEARSEQRPHILLITVDDMNWDTPGCFGGKVPEVTPNIDRLASMGMRFERGHVTVAVCQPSRQTLMTGRYPHRFGALGFSPIDPAIRTLPEVLADAGYVNGILGKVTHLQPNHKYQWTTQRNRAQMGYGRDPDTYFEETKKFIENALQQEKPFFLMANSHDPHRPFHGSRDEEKQLGPQRATFTPPSRIYQPEEIEIPGFLPELASIRKEIAQYYSSARRADDTVGAILKALEETGQADNTLIMFLSDNGMAFPTAKWNTYLQSTKTPWIVCWPGQVKPGSVDAMHFISGIDFMPTVLDAAGLRAPEGMDGRSFRPLLAGRDQAGRDQVVTAHYQAIHYYGNKQKRKAILDRMVSEGWRYKDEWGGLIKDYNIRCIQNRRFGYIFNAWADGKNRYLLGTGMAASGMKANANKKPDIKERLDMILYRTPEELYDLENDPDALDNLIDDPAHQDTLRTLRQELQTWMQQTGDALLPRFKQRAGQKR